jgi:PAS domain S-box-containing protein
MPMQEGIPRLNRPPRPPNQKSPPATERSSAPTASALPPDWPPNPQAFLETLIDMSLRGIGLADATGVIRYVNAVCQNIYGLPPQDIIGHHFREFYADSEALNRMLAQARIQGRVDGFPIMARQRGGAAVPVEISLVRVHDAAGRMLGSVALINDGRHSEDVVRQLQQQELALVHLNRSLELANLGLARANRLKDEFLANTSHELRTPLNSILGFLRLVLDKLCDNPAEEQEFIQNAYDSAKNLLILINELLDTARIEAGKVELTLVEVDIAQVFEEVKKLSRVQAAQKKLRLTFQPPEVTVRADPGKLQQILLNLVANAIKFTHEGKIQVKARVFRAKGHVRFEVRDTGIGIPPEIHHDLFQKFVQGNGSTTRQYGGSGLGLAICKNLVEFMGGQIWLTSAGPGLGATVFFTLPLVSSTPLRWRRLEDRERALQIAGPAAGPLVLVVEDEPQLVEIMTRILHKHGYRTAYAVTADDALEGARRLAPALITIDMGLPVRPRASLRNGLDLSVALKKDPQTIAIPQILVTGHEAALSQALDEIPPTLSKPFRARDLVAKVAALLSGK